MELRIRYKDGSTEGLIIEKFSIRDSVDNSIYVETKNDIRLFDWSKIERIDVK